MFFCKQKTAYEMRISDWRSDGCSADRRCLRCEGKGGQPKGVATMTNEAKPRVYGVLAKAFLQEGVSTCFALLGDANMNWGARKIGRASWREGVCQYV